MSSQDNTGIPLSHAPDGLGYKLLELPLELQSLLEAEDAPVITLESSPSAAILRTPDKTYSLRQKNTSNALMLLAPSTSTPTDPTQLPQTGLSVVATVHETIELIAEPAPGQQLLQTKNTGSRGKWHEKFGKGR